MAKVEKLTDHQREELARFVEKMNTLVPSEQQQVIFERAKTNTGRYVINAGPGSGKCVLPNTRVAINGQLIPIEQVWGTYHSAETYDGEGYFYAPKELLEVDSFNEATGQFERKQVESIYRQKVNEIVHHVTLDDGNTIALTQQHKLFNGLEWTNSYSEGDAIAVPQKIAQGTRSFDTELAEFLGWFIGEGYDLPNEHGTQVYYLTMRDKEPLEHIQSILTTLENRYNLPHSKKTIRTYPKRNTYIMSFAGRSLTSLLTREGFTHGLRSKDKVIPSTLMNADKEATQALLQALFDAEGSIHKVKGVIELSSASQMLIKQIAYLLRRFGIWGIINKMSKAATNGKNIKRDYYRIIIGSTDAKIFAKEIGFSLPYKTQALNESILRKTNPNKDVLPSLALLQALYQNHKLGRQITGLPSSGHLKSKNLSRETYLKRVRPQLSKLSQIDTKLYGNQFRSTIVIDTKTSTQVTDTLEALDQLCSQHLHYSRIRSIRKETYTGYVYDLCVEDTHNFVAENILCHNTTTAIKLSTFFTDTSSIYFSFNKKIQVDTTRKLNALGSKMIASTVHSFGLMCMNDYFPSKCEMKNSKYDDLIESYIEKHWNSFFSSIRSSLSDKELEKSGEWLYDTKTWSRTLIKYHQLSLSGLDPVSLKGLIEQFDLTDINPKAHIWPFVVANVTQAIDEGKKQFWDTHLIDFNDMIYYPAIFTEIPVQTYKHIIIDEAQDTSETGLTLILRACDKDTQVFAVGDPRQSIYVFAGAKETSIPDIIHSLNAEVLPLRTCYRCGSKIVKLANQLDGQLTAAGKHEGNVKVISSKDYLEQLQPKDAVIGRTTARLIKDCLKVLQTGKRAIVLGKNIGDSITGIITKIEARRISRGIPALAPNLVNFIELLDQHMIEQTKIINETRKKNPELAVSELQDKVDTAKAFYEAYVTKCLDVSERRETDPHCEYDRTARDFKSYIKGLFTDEENETIIQFMTAHRSKGLEFERVFIIGTEEFPHPKAKSDQQQRQEQNIMYVAITRAINDLYFVDAPFTSINIPDYDPNAERLTIISAPGADVLSISPYDSSETQFHHDEIQEESYQHPLILPTPLMLQEIQPIQEVLEKQDAFSTKELLVAQQESLPTLKEAKKQDAFVGKLLALEVLCPNCSGDCADPNTGSLMITEDLIGHSVTCVECHTSSLVPLNAFSLAGSVIAREKPTTSGPNNKADKKGRTQKERKSNAGRKTKSGTVRQPRQLSLDIRTIRTLDAMKVNNSDLFETLLQQYEPFLNAWAEMGYQEYQGDDE